MASSDRHLEQHSNQNSNQNSNQWISHHSQFAETHENADLKQRLGLYQVFLKLYEHNRELLDEILNLEASSSRALTNVRMPYVQGMMLTEPHLVTNLANGRTQALLQPEFRWTIGRNPQWSTITVADRRISRTHAAIEYVVQQGFYLTDLGSRNSTFVNGEPIRRSVLLNDGDRIRLGSLSFIFFLCTSARRLASSTASANLPLPACSSPITYSPFSITPPEGSKRELLQGEPDISPVNSPQEPTFSFIR